MLFRNMSPSETTGNFSAAFTQYFTENAGLQLKSKVSAFPLSSHSDSGEGNFFRGFTTVRLRYDLLLCLPSLSEQTGFITQPTRTFTSGLPMVWSPAPSPDITTAPTGKLALAGLPPARSSTSFTALTSKFSLAVWLTQKAVWRRNGPYLARRGVRQHGNVAKLTCSDRARRCPIRVQFLCFSSKPGSVG
jgi:hypothetical protein